MTEIDLPRPSKLWSVEDVDKYNTLPFYLAVKEATLYPKWLTWNKCFGKRKWTPNMGNILRTIIPEPSPIVRQMFFPKPITELPLVDVTETRERTEDARVYRHNYESRKFAFLPSFRDFRKNQIKFYMSDLTEKVAHADDLFCRSVVFHRSPYVYICGKGAVGSGAFAGQQLVSAPTGDGNSAGTSAKTTAWLQEAASYVGSHLSFKAMKHSKVVFEHDIRAPYYEGMSKGSPKDNDLVKGRYLFIGSTEAFEHFSFDEFILANKDLNMDLINSEFSGTIGRHIAYRSERFPLRMKADGTFPEPETVILDENAYNEGEHIPNPEYVNAPFEWGFFLGYEAYDAIDVGPAPKEFSNMGNGTEIEKINKLNWNGKVRLTDKFNIRYSDGNIDFNKYGEYVQCIADAVHAMIPNNRRYVLPVLYRRQRVAAN